MAMACKENGTSEEVNQLKEVIRQLTPCIMCVQYRGGAQYRGGSVPWRYHEYHGGIS